MTPRVSVLIPTFDREALVGRAVASILEQRFTDFECIVVDDGSRDATAERVAAIEDPRLRFARNDKNLGIPTTRNRGIDLARGEYLALLDSDDQALPERLGQQVAFLDAHPEISGVGSWFHTLAADGRRGKRVRTCPTSPIGLHFALHFRCVPRQSTMMFRREVLATARYDESCSVSEDLELFGRLSASGHALQVLPRPLVLFGRHEGRITRQPHPEREAIRRRILTTRLLELGLDPSPGQIDLHMRLTERGRSREEVDDEFVLQAGAWLEKVASRFASDGVLHPEVRDEAAWRWLKLLRRAARHGRPVPLRAAPTLSAALGRRGTWLRALRIAKACTRRVRMPC